MNLEQFVRGLPKAELHLHIEGSLEPEMVFSLARKHKAALRYPSVEALRAAYDFGDLQSFLGIYYEGASVLREAEDFHALTAAYLKKAHADGVVHAEIFCDPQAHRARRADAGGARGHRRRARGNRSDARRERAAHRLLPAAPVRGRGARTLDQARSSHLFHGVGAPFGKASRAEVQARVRARGPRAGALRPPGERARPSTSRRPDLRWCASIACACERSGRALAGRATVCPVER